jgi:hypothetical protein
MKQRNLSYEDKFRKYLFSFDLETHKEICKNINVKDNQKTILTDKEFLQEQNEDEIFSVIESFLNRLIDKNMLISNELRNGYLELPILDKDKSEIIKQMIKDYKRYKN